MRDMEDRALEMKVARPQTGDIGMAFEGFMQAFESFKQANDERLAQLERRMATDVLTEEKVGRINMALDEQKQQLDALVLKAARPRMGTSGGQEQVGLDLNALQHKSAFHAYMRKGEAQGLAALEAKALSVGSGPDGGYLVPQETETEIGRLLGDVSPIRAIASVRQVSGATYKKPFVTTGAATGWVAETDARTQTTSPSLASIEFPTMELYAMPAATQSLLDDAAVNIDQWIVDEVRTVFAEQESAAFVAGDGSNKPRGFLDYNTVANSSWSWGNLGHLATGVSGGFAATDAADILIDLVYSLKAGYRQNGRWVMNRKTQAAVRKIKDGDGNYLWQPALQAGSPASLMGFPVVEAEAMPDIAADATAIAFGDFRRGYLIVDRLGMRVLRDPYSAKPYVLFYTTKRVGGGVQDFDAIKLLKFGTA
ncbi:phage major capsid protein [Rhodoligotrophos ferricapiens]|uniref:phage major capsid protein n=1 Tax=Rhodoligotrophos ferricapiens TaxID=3069264 RepID=UPI003D818EB7